MALTSFGFLCFLAVLLLLYYVVPGKLQNPLLMLANMMFCYFAGGWYLVLFIAGLTVLTYIIAILLEKYKLDNKKQKCVMVLAACLCVGVLFVLKYINFFVYTGRGICGLFGISNSWTTINIIAPLGISFYMLQLIGYFIDVQRGVCKAQRNFLQYGLFATFFPQITSGPINRYADMEPQFASVRKFDYTQFMFGLQRIAWGFFKKLVISERMAVIVNTVFRDFNTYSGFYIVVAIICFAFQLYTDFSGYVDIALGASQSLGLKLSENFNNPFFSRSLSEFWRRWHITLGAWFKDYVFYPVLKSELFIKIGNYTKKHFGKKRGKKIPTYLGMFVLWFLTGLWHGGSWNYIIGSGLLHWFYIVGGLILEPVFDKIKSVLKINVDWLPYRIFQSFRTVTLVCIGWIFFRAESMTVAFKMIKAIFTFDTGVFNCNNFLALGLDAKDFIVALISILVLLIVMFVKEKTDVREVLSKQHIVIRWTVYLALVLVVFIFGYYGLGYEAGDFIYQQF